MSHGKHNNIKKHYILFVFFPPWLPSHVQNFLPVQSSRSLERKLFRRKRGLENLQVTGLELRLAKWSFWSMSTVAACVYEFAMERMKMLSRSKATALRSHFKANEQNKTEGHQRPILFLQSASCQAATNMKKTKQKTHQYHTYGQSHKSHTSPICSILHIVCAS